MSNELKNALTIERYKYILERRKQLNENTFKIASVYQALFVVVSGVQLTVLDRFYAKSLSREVVAWSSNILLIVDILVSVVSGALIIGGIFAWLKYRRDEDTLLVDAGLAARAPLRKVNLLTWYESYIVAVIVVTPVAHWLFVGTLK